LPGAASLDRRAFAAGGNRPNDPFNGIPINKFYVLDLQPKNWFIKWAVDQGHTATEGATGINGSLTKASSTV
jgi:hypothetical protein